MAEPLPDCETLKLDLNQSVLTVTLNRPEVRNAMNLAMVSEMEAVLEAAKNMAEVRVLVLRGEGGHFCAGGDIKDMAAAIGAPLNEGEPDPVATTNRRFGTFATRFDEVPQPVVAVLEGVVMGGGMGMACMADVAIARADASFRLPETGLGVLPAQITPFLVRRLGLSQALRLAVTGGRFDGREAHAIGLVHFVCDDDGALEAKLAETLKLIKRCAPQAVASTKALMLKVGTVDIDDLLDEAAGRFAEAFRGPEGQEGMMAFLQKRKPEWASEGN